jgi:hypothetical protein
MKDRLKALLSRKFIAFVVASVFLYLGKLPAEYWAGVAGAYIGLNVLQTKLTGGK